MFLLLRLLLIMMMIQLIMDLMPLMLLLMLRLSDRHRRSRHGNRTRRSGRRRLPLRIALIAPSTLAHGATGDALVALGHPAIAQLLAPSAFGARLRLAVAHRLCCLRIGFRHGLYCCDMVCEREKEKLYRVPGERRKNPVKTGGLMTLWA